MAAADDDARGVYVDHPANEPAAKPHLTTLPAELQQQIYYLAGLPNRCSPEDYQRSALSLMCTSTGVQRHLLEAMKVYGTETEHLFAVKTLES